MYSFGLAHAANNAPSSEHSNTAPTSDDTNENEAALTATVPDGPAVKTVSGATVSTDHTCSAGEASTLPARSRARTRNTCAPSPNPANDAGDKHTKNTAPSSEHSNVTPGSDANANTAAAEADNTGGTDTNNVSGGVVSTVQEALVLPELPAASVAVSSKVCVPSPRPVRSYGLEHGAAASASRRQENVAPGSSAVNSKWAEVEFVNGLGAAEMDGTGAIVSTVHVRAAGVASAFPTASTARTRKVCAPGSTTGAMMMRVKEGGETGPSSSCHW